MSYVFAFLFGILMFALLVLWSVIEFYVDLRKKQRIKS